MARMTCPYHRVISEVLQELGHPEVDPRVVEAAMRLRFGVLDHLTKQDFKDEARVAIVLVRDYPKEAKEMAEGL